MSKPTTFLCSILTTHERNGWPSKHVNEWMANTLFDMAMGYATGNPTWYHIMFTHAHNFMPAASARNYFCRTMRDTEPKPDWLVMIDNDMAPPANLLECVRGAPEDASIIVPRFSMWDEAKLSVTLCWGMDEKFAPMKSKRQFFSLQDSGFYPLTKCGTGAIFIKPEVFNKITMPYFWYPLNDDQGLEGTEDIKFCEKVIAAGLKIYGNAGISVGHYHNVNLDSLSRALYEAEKLGFERATNGGKVVLGVPERPSEAPVAAACPA